MVLHQKNPVKQRNKAHILHTVNITQVTVYGPVCKIGYNRYTITYLSKDLLATVTTYIFIVNPKDYYHVHGQLTRKS